MVLLRLQHLSLSQGNRHWLLSLPSQSLLNSLPFLLTPTLTSLNWLFLSTPHFSLFYSLSLVLSHSLPLLGLSHSLPHFSSFTLSHWSSLTLPSLGLSHSLPHFSSFTLSHWSSITLPSHGLSHSLPHFSSLLSLTGALSLFPLTWALSLSLTSAHLLPLTGALSLSPLSWALPLPPLFELTLPHWRAMDTLSHWSLPDSP